jgi:DNA repair exonuclease SbcCD ATPase subunit
LVTIKVKNVQSIEDATIVVDGFTTITGTNNSGKTAVMRAIKGVFTNPPASPLLRHGCAYFTVSIEFGDGTTVVWEKGWEKPDQKGKTINRYRVNGVLIESVGSGVPPEVEALGVRSINAASDSVWPQIAEQFDGTLFLVNKSGASVAEALSDVEKVGKLTSALKLSERDKRSCESELKIRRKDLAAKRAELSKYDGLDSLGVVVKNLASRKAELDRDLELINRVDSLNSRLLSARSRFHFYSGFDPEIVPDPFKVVRMDKGVKKVEGLQSRLSVLRDSVSRFRGFQGISVPDDSEIREVGSRLSKTESLMVRHRNVKNLVARYSGFHVDIPKDPDAARNSDGLKTMRSLVSKLESARKQVSELRDQESKVSSELSDREAEVAELLGDRGFCPTCNAVYDHGGPHLSDHLSV